MTPQHDEDLRIWGSNYKEKAFQFLITYCLQIYDLPRDSRKLNSTERRRKLGGSPGADEGNTKETPASQGPRGQARAARAAHKKNHIPFTWTCYTPRCPRLGSAPAPATAPHSRGEITGAREARAGHPLARLMHPAYITVRRATLQDAQAGTAPAQDTHLKACGQQPPRMAPGACCNGAARAREYHPDVGGRKHQDTTQEPQHPLHLRASAGAPSLARPRTPHLSPPLSQKEQRKTSNAPSKHMHPLALALALAHATLTSCSARRRLPLPRSSSRSSSPSPPIRARAYPSSAPSEAEREQSRREPSASGRSRARARMHLHIAPVAVLELPYLVAAASGPVTAPILEAPGGTCGAVWRYCALVECLLSTVGVRGAENSGRAVKIDVSESVGRYVAIRRLYHYGLGVCERSSCKADVSESKGVWMGRGVEEVERGRGKRGRE
ncbi:hypothetical protein B0H13DRAFT_2281476 [Mycena leptocephala]|nr:hypothetical protein B0H13DRAFT_2281476 [Mycena leptocephala]